MTMMDLFFRFVSKKRSSTHSKTFKAVCFDILESFCDRERVQVCQRQIEDVISIANAPNVIDVDNKSRQDWRCIEKCKCFSSENRLIAACRFVNAVRVRFNAATKTMFFAKAYNQHIAACWWIYYEDRQCGIFDSFFPFSEISMRALRKKKRLGKDEEELLNQFEWVFFKTELQCILVCFFYFLFRWRHFIVFLEVNDTRHILYDFTFQCLADDCRVVLYVAKMYAAW